MVRWNAGTKHVKSQAAKVKSAGPNIEIQKSSGPDRVSAQYSILTYSRRTPCAS
jgi:hypothetical protein